jgi:hypothetical protein
MYADSLIVFNIFETLHTSTPFSVWFNVLQCPPLVYAREVHQMNLHVMNLVKRKLLYLIQFNDHLKKHTNVFQIVKLNPLSMGLNYHGLIFYNGGWQQNLITDIEILVIFIRLMLFAKSL